MTGISGIGESLKTLREQVHVPVEQLAAKMETDARTVREIESDHIELSSTLLVNYVLALSALANTAQAETSSGRLHPQYTGGV